ncbi:MAG: hypothetical protein NTY97_02705, partial [Planctomycetota bacterium]|nr:hypothetical protein [Planctomycetota bacterium]
LQTQARALARCHPDRHPEGVERELAVMRSAQINAAATILVDPLLRAEALIAFSDPMGKAVPLAAAQLMELLEQRESMEASTKSSLAESQACEEWVRCEKQSTTNQLEILFSSTPADWVAIRAAVAYLRAIVRLSNELNRLLELGRTENR